MKLEEIEKEWHSINNEFVKVKDVGIFASHHMEKLLAVAKAAKHLIGPRNVDIDVNFDGANISAIMDGYALSNARDAIKELEKE